MKTIVLSRFLVTVFLLISFNRVYADPLTLATFDMEKYLNIDEPSIIANYSQGEQLYNQGQYQEAIDHFANNIAWGESIQFLGDNYYKAQVSSETNNSWLLLKVTGSNEKAYAISILPLIYFQHLLYKFGIF